MKPCRYCGGDHEIAALCLVHGDRPLLASDDASEDPEGHSTDETSQPESPSQPLVRPEGLLTRIVCRTPGEAALVASILEEADILPVLPGNDAEAREDAALDP